MSEQMRPASPKQAPDPSHSYERSHPEREAGMGELDAEKDATPKSTPDKMENATPNRQAPDRQINGQDEDAR